MGEELENLRKQIAGLGDVVLDFVRKSYPWIYKGDLKANQNKDGKPKLFKLFVKLDKMMGGRWQELIIIKESQLDYTIPFPSLIYNAFYKTKKLLKPKLYIVVLDTVLSGLKAGKTESAIFESLAKLDTLPPYIRKVCYDISVKTLTGGNSLYECFVEYKNIFGEKYLPVLYSGEVLHTYQRSFEIIRTKIQSGVDLKKKIRKLTMPSLLALVVMIIGFVGVALFLVPMITDIVPIAPEQFPPRLKMLYDWRVFLLSPKVLILPLIGLGIVILFKNRILRNIGGLFILNLPKVGGFYREYSLLQFLVEMSFLMGTNSLSDTQYVEMSLNTISNDYLRYMFEQAFQPLIRNEKSMGQAFGDLLYVDTNIKYLIETHEQNGELKEGIDRATKYCQDAFNNTVDQLEQYLPNLFFILIALLLLYLAPIMNEVQNVFTQNIPT